MRSLEAFLPDKDIFDFERAQLPLIFELREMIIEKKKVMQRKERVYRQLKLMGGEGWA